VTGCPIRGVNPGGAKRLEEKKGGGRCVSIWDSLAEGFLAKGNAREKHCGKCDPEPDRVQHASETKIFNAGIDESFQPAPSMKEGERREQGNQLGR